MSISEYIMMGSLGVTLILSVIAIILGIMANAKYVQLFRKYDYFMRGRDAETLEDYFVELQSHVENLEDEDEKNKELIRILNRSVRASYQKFGLVKYNAFGRVGGNMSFALALLDFTNTGFIINSVHSNEGCFLYIKDVDAGTTEVELGAEEKLALEQALGYRERDNH